MLPIKPVTCCPHCGGTWGFRTDIVLKAERMTGWNDDVIDTDSYTLVSETNPVCMDCGRSVRSLFFTRKNST